MKKFFLSFLVFCCFAASAQVTEPQFMGIKLGEQYGDSLQKLNRLYASEGISSLSEYETLPPGFTGVWSNYETGMHFGAYRLNKLRLLTEDVDVLGRVKVTEAEAKDISVLQKKANDAGYLTQGIVIQLYPENKAEGRLFEKTLAELFNMEYFYEDSESGGLFILYRNTSAQEYKMGFFYTKNNKFVDKMVLYIDKVYRNGLLDVIEGRAFNKPSTIKDMADDFYDVTSNVFELVSESDDESESKLIRVGVVQVTAESDWRRAVNASIKETFTREKGYELSFVDAIDTQEKQIEAMRSFIEQDVDYIILTPAVQDGWETVLDEAREACIPVILSDRNISVFDEDLFQCRVGTDYRRQGHDAVRWLESYLAENGRAEEDINIVDLQGRLEEP